MWDDYPPDTGLTSARSLTPELPRGRAGNLTSWHAARRRGGRYPLRPLGGDLALMPDASENSARHWSTLVRPR
jgi:hypothetical protein